MITLTPGTVTLDQLRLLWSGTPARLSDDALTAIDAAAASVPSATITMPA